MPPVVLRPTRYLVRMVLFLIVVGGVVAWRHQVVLDAFEKTPAFNALILAVLLLGMLFMFRLVFRLSPEVTWVNRYAANPQHAPLFAQPPVLLGPLAQMLTEERGESSTDRPSTLTPQTVRTLMDGLGHRMEEGREISRYTVGLLIFLGLLGTFWGLIQTVGSIGDVISGLAMGGNDLATMWNELKEKLQAPLAGMGTSFASSLFGLAGSLILGFLDLQVGQAQSRFYLDVEDWLSGRARLSGDGEEGSGQRLTSATGAPGSYADLSHIVAQNAENIDALRKVVATAEAQRRQTIEVMRAMSEQVTTLTQQLRSEQKLLLQISEERHVLGPAILRLNELLHSGKLHEDQPGLVHLRNIETIVRLLADSQADTRDRMVHDLSSEIRLVSRTLRSLAEPGLGNAPGLGG